MTTASGWAWRAGVRAALLGLLTAQAGVAAVPVAGLAVPLTGLEAWADGRRERHPAAVGLCWGAALLCLLAALLATEYVRARRGLDPRGRPVPEVAPAGDALRGVGRTLAAIARPFERGGRHRDAALLLLVGATAAAWALAARLTDLGRERALLLPPVLGALGSGLLALAGPVDQGRRVLEFVVGVGPLAFLPACALCLLLALADVVADRASRQVHRPALPPPDDPIDRIPKDR